MNTSESCEWKKEKLFTKLKDELAKAEREIQLSITQTHEPQQEVEQNNKKDTDNSTSQKRQAV